jgi:lipopolysaccharide transport system ATP-binding protein
MRILELSKVGKAYYRYASEWQRVARIMGRSVAAAEEHWVLRDIDFDLRAGESIGIVGRNGAGKSTLLKMITGTVYPSYGEVRYYGSPHIAAILELGLGFLPEFTGRQNARHTLELMGVEPRETERVLPEIESFADIGDYFDQPVRTYSSGMQTRVAFATVTAIRPDLLIVDEALSVGDAHFQAKCFDRIGQYRRHGTALILVTHAMADVVTHCDRAILLARGRVLADGAPADVTNLYFDNLFGGNRAEGEQGAREEEEGDDFGAGDEELFHTRPGFRKEEHRWGEGGAVIKDYRISAAGNVYPAEIESGTQTEFSFQVRFDADFDSVIPGILIKTLDGIFVYGTNSHAASSGAGPRIHARRGETRIFRFEMPLALNGGDYLVSFGVSAGDPRQNAKPLERRYDALIIHISRSVPFWGLVDLVAKFDEVSPATR